MLMHAAVEAPDARRLVHRCRHNVLAVWSHAHRGRFVAVALERAHMLAVVEAPHARRLVVRPGHHVLAVWSHAHRYHPLGVPLERQQLRTFCGGPRTRAISSGERAGPNAFREAGM
uniref:Uncharacterized protein n=1 Tax=Chrysotila carterae TaxID=13221 RepID=A0A7S4BVH8_CHRCT